MTDYLQAATEMQKRVRIPVVADCDTGFGNNWNAQRMIHEYEAAGITAVCIEDKTFPKMNSFAPGHGSLLPVGGFATRIQVAKAAQSTDEMMVIARTEALICGTGLDDALARCEPTPTREPTPSLFIRRSRRTPRWRNS